jgi:hypothetical protein
VEGHQALWGLRGLFLLTVVLCVEEVPPLSGILLIAFPAANDQREIDKHLNLDTSASAFLWQRVSQLVDDITRHCAVQAEMAKGRNRAERLRYIKTLTSRWTTLENQLAQRDGNIDTIFRSQLGRRLGELLSHRGIERLIDTSPGYSVGARFPPARVEARDDGLYQALEEEMLQRRVNLAEQAAPRLLIALVRELNRPLVRFLYIERQNKGGAPAKLYRNYAVEQLVPVYQAIYGIAPTPGGEFALLCELIIAAIGLDTIGLDQAVARILRRLKAD